MTPRKVPHAAVLLALCAFAPVPAWSARVTLPDQTAGLGQSVIAAVSFSSEGHPVTGLQFDLECDPGLSLRLFPGTRIGSSVKTIHSTTLPDGALRVIIVGINQTTIEDGDVLRPVLFVDANAAPGAVGIRITNASATDHHGNQVALDAVAATVNVQSGAAGRFAPAAVVNGASLLPGPVSPGEIVTILGGLDLSAASAVLFNDLPAPILYTGPGQVNAVVPMRLEPRGNITLRVRTLEAALPTLSLTSEAATPAIFTQGSAGAGPGVILNEDYTVNSFSNPASVGSVVIVYGTGFGLLRPAAVDGQPADGPAPTATAVSAMIGGVPTEVLYAGAAPSLVAGVVQINVRIPRGIPPNPVAPVSFWVGSAATPSGVTVSVR
jgi:uncharacterized protein (TIGR03437 family)